MSYTHTQIQSVTADGTDTCRATINLVGNSEQKVTNLVLAANAANYPVNAAFLHANLVSWFAYTNQSVKIVTNAAGGPGDTVNITANSPSAWWDTSCATNPFANNVTELYLTNLTGSPARVDLKWLWNN